ncbi:interleukin-1 receptor type 1-like [Sparus aurata]|uniref:Interleukin 1 receptor like 1 n=1 Tax=Sparus aurata TaxID=8175 RepID=A0A671V9U6_SPAAU|nr:interleukin-1 receptor type 1-like [Sparus aurata]
MDPSRLLFLIFTLMSPFECSEPAKLQCVESDKERFILLEGEAFYIMPYDLTETYYPDEEFTWYKNDSRISNDESKNVHYHGGALYFLNVSAEDSGFYHARRNYSSGNCSNHYVVIKVVDDINKALYVGENNSHGSLLLYCPNTVTAICEVFRGNLSWMKDFKLLQDQKDEDLWIENIVKEDAGIYTCTCTWEHNQRVYKSSGSRRFKPEIREHHQPRPVIISPAEKEIFADEGYGITLNCTVLCGTNVERDCHASWEPVNGPAFKERHGYHVKTSVANERNNTYATAVLTIDRVSSEDLQTEFKCTGKGFYDEALKGLRINGRVSIVALAIRGACVLFIAVLGAVLVKCFAIDLTLCFRRYCPRRSQKKDVGMYDAYVVYQMQSMDKATEETLCQFISNHLPSVLEEKCGYRLFIHGRDDIPGEDHLELVEARMKQSRRLMVILTPGSGSGCDITDQHPASPHSSMTEGLDWQLGLHRALVQREMSVILIEIGDIGREGYKHLPPGLQHLILHRAPIRWPEGSRGAASWNSRFWKRVRFQMPATPANECSQSAII